MRILIQSTETWHYFKSIDSWTPDPDEASDFKDTTAAVRFCRENKFSKVRVVLKFYDHRPDIHLSERAFPKDPQDPPSV